MTVINGVGSESALVKRISVANQKGGVGKTTTSVNFAASLALAGHKTLLIDLDPQGNASSGLGVDRFVSKTIYDALIGNTDIMGASLDTGIQNLLVIPANQNLIGAEVELINSISREKKLKNALKGIQNEIEYVIFDCPPSLGLLTVNAFTASDSILIPLQCEYYALEGLGQLLNTYQIVKEDLNQDLQLEGVLLTMFDSRNRLTHEVMGEMRSHFSNDLLETKIPRNVKLSEAPSFGRPVAFYDVDSKGAQAYFDLTKEFLKRNNQATPDFQEFIQKQRAAARAARQATEDNLREKAVEEIQMAEAETTACSTESVPEWKNPYAIEKIEEIPVRTKELSIEGAHQ